MRPEDQNVNIPELLIITTSHTNKEKEESQHDGEHNQDKLSNLSRGI